MKWPDGKWPYLFLTVVLLIITRLVAPDTAAWILAPIVNLTTAGFEILRDTIGG